MKSVLLGLCLMAIVSTLAWVIVGTQVKSSGEAFVSQNNSVRLD